MDPVVIFLVFATFLLLITGVLVYRGKQRRLREGTSLHKQKGEILPEDVWEEMKLAVQDQLIYSLPLVRGIAGETKGLRTVRMHGELMDKIDESLKVYLSFVSEYVLDPTLRDELTTKCLEYRRKLTENISLVGDRGYALPGWVNELETAIVNEKTSTREVPDLEKENRTAIDKVEKRVVERMHEMEGKLIQAVKELRLAIQDKTGGNIDTDLRVYDILSRSREETEGRAGPIRVIEELARFAGPPVYLNVKEFLEIYLKLPELPYTEEERQEINDSATRSIGKLCTFLYGSMIRDDRTGSALSVRLPFEVHNELWDAKDFKVDDWLNDVLGLEFYLESWSENRFDYKSGPLPPLSLNEENGMLYLLRDETMNDKTKVSTRTFLVFSFVEASELFQEIYKTLSTKFNDLSLHDQLNDLAMTCLGPGQTRLYGPNEPEKARDYLIKAVSVENPIVSSSVEFKIDKTDFSNRFIEIPRGSLKLNETFIEDYFSHNTFLKTSLLAENTRPLFDTLRALQESWAGPKYLIRPVIPETTWVRADPPPPQKGFFSRVVDAFNKPMGGQLAVTVVPELPAPPVVPPPVELSPLTKAADALFNAQETIVEAVFRSYTANDYSFHTLFREALRNPELKLSSKDKELLRNLGDEVNGLTEEIHHKYSEFSHSSNEVNLQGYAWDRVKVDLSILSSVNTIHTLVYMKLRFFLAKHLDHPGNYPDNAFNKDVYELELERANEISIEDAFLISHTTLVQASSFIAVRYAGRSQSDRDETTGSLEEMRDSGVQRVFIIVSGKRSNVIGFYEALCGKDLSKYMGPLRTLRNTVVANVRASRSR